MKKFTILLFLFCIGCNMLASAQNKFPDGTKIPNWFYKNELTKLSDLGKIYVITEHGVAKDSLILQTNEIQAVIDRAAQNGGGAIVIPEGTFLTGALFFKQGTHLHLAENARLKGSDDIVDFPLLDTRIEGESCRYFSALINADGLDGFTISGKGTIDGNGLRYWRAFWLRRAFNPTCTNKDEMRPRLVYVSNCKNVQLSNVRLVNSPFWTTHFYKCENVKLLSLYIYSPKAPVKAPSTDAVDVDVCTNMLIKNCYMSVNDDAVALKGGKGFGADEKPENGENRNIIIEDCTYGFCHGALTCGSESVHNYNIILRNITINNAQRLLWLKMRPDTPQNYEYIEVSNIKGDVKTMLYIKPWTQFFNLPDGEQMPKSYSSNIVMRNLELTCDAVFDVQESNQYELTDFTFEKLQIKGNAKKEIPLNFIQNVKVIDVEVVD